MGFVRSFRRFGARLALAALVLQLVLSFGHVHLHGIGTSPRHTIAGSHNAAIALASHKAPAQNTGGDDDYCAICASIFLVSTSFVSAPPKLTVPVGYERIAYRFNVDRGTVAPRRAAFQSRAPPAA